MVFIIAKSKQTNKFSLDGFKSQKAVKSHAGLSVWQKFTIAAVIGALLALSGPGFDQWWLAWFMVAPFLVLLTYCHKNIEPLFCGLFFGLGYHFVSLHYYFDMAFVSNGQSMISGQTAILIGILQVIMLSLPTMVFAWLIAVLPLRSGYIPYLKRPFFPYLLSVPLLWVFLHWGLAIANPFTHIWQSIQIPAIFIDPLVYSQYCSLEMMQLVKFVGPAGFEFLLVLVNTTIAALVVQLVKTQDGPVERVDLISPRAGALLDILVSLVVVAASYALGHMLINQAIVQANDPIISSDPKNEMAQPIEPIGIVCGDWLLHKESSLVERQLAILVFPESTKEVNLDQVDSVLNKLKTESEQNKNSVFLNFVSKEGHNLTRHNLIFGTTNSLNIKQQISESGQNSFLEGTELGQRVLELVNQFKTPDTLSVPVKKWIFAFDKNSPSSWYSLKLPMIREGKVGLLSASDITDYRLVAYEVRHGASLLISSMDLSWSRNKYLDKQLLAAAIFRAIENNRYVIVSSKDGVSAIIEPYGVVQSISFGQNAKQSSTGESPIVLGTVQFLWSKTPFTKMWWL